MKGFKVLHAYLDMEVKLLYAKSGNKSKNKQCELKVNCTGESEKCYCL